MLVYPNAKINIGLSVVARRADGYHDLRTVFYPLPLCDILEITLPEVEGREYVWQQTGNAIDGAADDNICLRALRALRAVRQLPCVGLHLHKLIPTGAGLGGGSADGAFVIKHLNQMLRLGLTGDEMRHIAASIGADCPFFIDNRPAYAEGIGDQLSPIDIDLKGKQIILVKPNINVSTREAYQGITPHPAATDLREALRRPVDQWPGPVLNDFEPTVFRRYPAIEHIKDTLYNCGALYASMSGSGSAVYGIFDRQPDIRFADCFVWRGTMQY